MNTTSRISIVSLALLGACGSGNAAPDAGAIAPIVPDTCKAYGFREPTPEAVVCPGAPMCLCTGGDGCCMQAIDSKSGVCEPMGRCRTLVIRCDGPEDCAAPSPDAGTAAQVCCLDESVGMTGGGSECRAANTCTGKILCRQDEDCVAVSPTLLRCHPADYGTTGVEDRGLDGLIGYCGK